MKIVLIPISLPILSFFLDIVDSFYMHSLKMPSLINPSFVFSDQFNRLYRAFFFWGLGYFTASVYYLGVRFGGIPRKLKRLLGKYQMSSNLLFLISILLTVSVLFKISSDLFYDRFNARIIYLWTFA